MMSVWKPSLILTLAVLTSITWAQTAPNPNPADTAKFPYIGQVTGTDVYVRSGPGTAYYFTSKVNQPAQVTVTGHKYGWAQILPLESSFSWISRNHVKPDPTNPGFGIVEGDSVAVWCGAENLDPLRSPQMQGRLNKGDSVRIIGPPVGDYYKIAPPASARLWISVDFIKYLRPAPAEPQQTRPTQGLRLPPRPDQEPRNETNAMDRKVMKELSDIIAQDQARQRQTAQQQSSQEQTAQATEEETDDPFATTETGSDTETRTADAAQDADTAAEESERPSVVQFIVQVRDIAAQLDAEIQKPLLQQDFSQMQAALQQMQENPNIGSAKNYVDYYLSRIRGFELVRQTVAELQQQDSELEKIRRQINLEHQRKLGNLPNRGKYIISGKLEESQVYTAKTGQKRYIITSDTGKVLAYAIPADRLTEHKVVNLIGHKVGVVGTVVSDPKNPLTLVEFKDLEPMGEIKTASESDPEG